jgi:hypothetical protein
MPLEPKLEKVPKSRRMTPAPAVMSYRLRSLDREDEENGESKVLSFFRENFARELG